MSSRRKMTYYQKKKKKTVLAYFAAVGASVAVLAFVFLQVNFIQTGRFSFRSSAYTKVGQGAYSFSCLQTAGCYNKADTDPTKASCYTGCRNANLSASRISQTSFAENEKTFMARFLGWYSRVDAATGRLLTTTYGAWRSRTISSGDRTTYYRTVCNTAAVAAVNGKVTNKPNAYFYNIADQVTAVFDDHRYWSGSWQKGAVGYPCAVAASLLWDKFSAATPWDRAIGNPNRSVAAKKTMIRDAIASTANSLYSDFPDPDNRYSTVEQAQAVYGPRGNSQAEEAGWNAAFLAMAANMLPTNSSKTNWENRAKSMAVFSYKNCTDNTRCPLGADFRVVNHEVNPQPQYGMSVIMNGARAGLPYFVLNGFNRDNIPSEFRILGANRSAVYTLTNVFEFQSSLIDFNTMSMRGSYTYKDSSRVTRTGNYSGQNYGNQTGVGEWGYGADMNVSPFAYMYVSDLYNSNGYRSTQGPIQAYIDAERAKAVANKLYLPTLPNSSGNGSYSFVDASKGVDIAFMVNFGGGVTSASSDVRLNTHFFLNSLKAFEHMVGYLYLNNRNYLSRM